MADPDPNPQAQPYDSQLALVESLRRQTESLLARVPVSWRPVLKSELLRNQNKKDWKPSTGRHWANSWAVVARSIGDRDPGSVSSAEWEIVVNDWLTKPQTRKDKPFTRGYAAALCVDLKQGLKRFYPSGKVPDEVKEALRVNVGEHRPKGRVLSKDDLLLLLDHITTKEAYTHSPRQVAEMVALVWVLWDSWMRVNEMLGLNLGDVELLGVKAKLHMRDDRPLQKRGPRPVPLVEAVPALKVWMQMHPAAGNPMAPLFCNLRCKDGLSRLSDSNLDQMLKRWGERSGLHASKTREKKLSAHDFRHTGNTRAARNRWEPTLRARKAGWKPDSRMLSRYTHLDEEDLHNQMLRDAGIDVMGFRQQVETGNVEAALGDLLALLVDRRRADPTALAPRIATDGPARI